MINDNNGFNKNDLDQLLTEKEAAELICYSQRALQNWRYAAAAQPM